MIRKYWNGEESLSKTFWLVWVAGSFLIAFVLSVLVYVISELLSFPGTQLAIVAFILLLLFNPYYLFCWVSVWRSSKNTDTGYYKWGVKLLVVMHVVSLSYDLVRMSEVLTLKL